MKSWRTTTLGVAALLSAIAAAVQTLLDGNPATNPDWPVLIALVSSAWGNIMARDNKVTSEQLGLDR